MRRTGDGLEVSHLCCGPRRQTLSRPVDQFCAQLMMWQNGRSLGHLSGDRNRDKEEHCMEKVQGSSPDGDSSGQ
jgi:hypothetical protein